MVQWVQKSKQLAGNELHNSCPKLNLQVSSYPRTLLQEASTLRFCPPPKAQSFPDQNLYKMSQRCGKPFPQNQHTIVDLEKGFLWDIPEVPYSQSRFSLHADDGNLRRAASLQTRQYTGRRTG